MGKKIIVLDGDNKVFKYIEKNINSMYRDALKVYHAKRYSTSERLINESGNIDLIVWGAFINDSGSETFQLLKMLKKDFSGKIIGLSNSKDQQARLVQSGCEVSCALQSMPFNIARSFTLTSS